MYEYIRAYVLFVGMNIQVESLFLRQFVAEHYTNVSSRIDSNTYWLQLYYLQQIY